MNKLFALLLILPLIASCSNGSSSEAVQAPTKTVTVTVTAEPRAESTPAPEPASKREIKLNNKEKLEWANSRNRKIMYQDYEKAKYVVAHALEDGRLGKPERYVEVKWRPGMSGWGVIGVNNASSPNMSKPTAFASVWIRSDGSIDYSRGITGMRIDAGPATRGVIIYDAMYGASLKPVPAYEAAIDQYTSNRGEVWSACIDDFGFCERKQKGMRLTVTGTELAQLDDAAITALDRSMSKLFGSDWRRQ